MSTSGHEVLFGSAAAEIHRLSWLVGIGLSTLFFMGVLCPAYHLFDMKPPTWMHRGSWAMLAWFLLLIDAFAIGLGLSPFLTFITTDNNTIHATFILAGIAYVMLIAGSWIYHSRPSLMMNGRFGVWWVGIVVLTLGALLLLSATAVAWSITDIPTGLLFSLATILTSIGVISLWFGDQTPTRNKRSRA